MSMYYRIKSDEKLFKVWRKLENETGERLLSSLVQNDMIGTTEGLNEEFDLLHTKLLELQEKYSQQFLSKIIDLRDETAKYIADLNTTPVTQEEINELERYYRR